MRRRREVRLVGDAAGRVVADRPRPQPRAQVLREVARRAVVARDHDGRAPDVAVRQRRDHERRAATARRTPSRPRRRASSPPGRVDVAEERRGGPKPSESRRAAGPGCSGARSPRRARAARRARRRRTARGGRVEALEMRAERDRAEILARVVGLHPDVVQPGPHVDPAEAAQPLGGLGVRTRSSTALASRPSAGANGSRSPTSPPPVERGHVAGAAACATSRPPGTSGQQPGEQPVVVGDPVEGGGREDRVDGPVELELEQVGDEDLDGVAEPARASSTIAGEPSTATTSPRGSRSHQRRGHPPGAAARVEHPLVAAQVEPVEHVAAHRLERRRHPLVRGGVPVAGRHAIVRYRNARPVTSRSTSSAARSTSASTSAAGWRHLPST